MAYDPYAYETAQQRAARQAAGGQTPGELYGSNAGAAANQRYAKNPFDANSQDPSERKRAEKWRKSVDKDLFNMSGAPTQNPFDAAVDPKTGFIKDVYKMTPGSINYSADTSGLDAIKARALGTGDSPWLKLMMEKQSADEAKQLSTSQAQAAGSEATARSNLAMKGGLSSGARERLARSGAEGLNILGQNIRGQGASDRIGLQTKEEDTKLGLLQQLPGAQLAKQAQDIGVQQFNVGQNTDAQRFNIGNSLNDLLQKRAYDTNTYNQQMKTWAAGKTADAQGSGGKK